MPRPKRIHYEGAVYHVTNRGNERRKIVTNDEDRWMFIRLLGEMIDENKIICHAWVLMDNHYHLLLEVPGANLSLAMKHLNALYTQKFNKKHHRVGHLFQGRFKAIVVEKESFLQELCRYVVLNPVRAHMVKHPKEWKWSSYRATAGMEKAEPWLEVDWILGQFGKVRKIAQAAYKRFVEDGLGKKNSPWDELSSRIYLGSDKFLNHVHEVGKQHQHLDVPKYQKSVVKHDPDKVIGYVAKSYGVKPEEVLVARSRKSEPKEAAIYLLKKESGLSLKEIGKRMDVSFGAIGHHWVKAKKRMLKDEAFAKRIAKYNL
jgi:REP element-mobilizing transposase RayT